MSLLLRIWEREGAVRSLFRAVPLMNQIKKKCMFKTREDFAHNSQTKPHFVSYIITGDEYWKCQMSYDPQTNLEIMDCRSTTQMTQKTHFRKSRIKFMFITLSLMSGRQYSGADKSLARPGRK